MSQQEDFVLVNETYRYRILGYWPKPEPYGLALDEHGRITRSLHDPTGKYLMEITSAKEYGGHLYLGSLSSDRIGKYKLP